MASPTREAGATEEVLEEGRNLLDQGNVAQALEKATSATVRDASNVEAWLLLGRSRNAWKDAAGALAAFEQASRLAPSQADAYNEMASIHLDAERWQEAHVNVKRALSIDSGNDTAKVYLGILLMKTGQMPTAMEHLETCTRDHPGNPVFRSMLALCLVQAATQQFTEIPEGGPHPPGLYLTSRKQVAAVAGMLQKAESTQYDDEVLVNIWGIRVSEAVESLRKDVQAARSRRFYGNLLLFAGAAGWALLSFVIFFDKGKSEMIGFGVYNGVLAMLYLLSCMVPQHMANARAIANKPGFDSTSAGCGAMAALAPFLPIFMPLLVVKNFLRSFVFQA